MTRSRVAATLIVLSLTSSCTGGADSAQSPDTTEVPIIEADNADGAEGSGTERGAESVEEALYLDASQSTDARIADLLDQMTLDDKIGQMTLVEKGSITPEQVSEARVGAVLSGGGGAPARNNPEAWLEMTSSFQEAALSTPLQIPLLYGIDAIHGHNNLRNAVIYPHNIGLGAAGDADLVERIGRATAIETTATGIYWNYAPVLAVVQDVRWGRTYESYGADPTLVENLGTALLRGLQGDDLSAADTMLATPKHFVADGGALWGTSTTGDYRIDQGDAQISEDELRAVHLEPYGDPLHAGALSVMASYTSWQGDKVHGSERLLTDILKDELGFDGFVVSDWGAVDQIEPGDYYGSVVAAINAGVDMNMVPTRFELFQTALRGAVEQGDIPMERIDDAVGRILRAKFELGLFERPVGSEVSTSAIGSEPHRDLAREAVAESMVLLVNDGESLPISPEVASVVVVGTAANDIGRQSGGWTISWQGGVGDVTAGTTILDGLVSGLGEDRVVYDKFGPSDNPTVQADEFDVGIAVIGERPYAEGVGDSEHLAFDDRHIEMVKRLRPNVDSLIVVIVAGRPMVLDEILPYADAIVTAWLPGSEGAAVADPLLGEVAFSGQLPVPWMRNVGQLPLGDGSGLADADDECSRPLFPMGHGLQVEDVWTAEDLPGAECDAA